jgi:formate dehydrogenase major subunit
MVVNTKTEGLQKSRKFILSMLFSERNHFCPFCQVSGGDCELQNAAYHEEMTHWPMQPGWNDFVVDTSHPYFVLDNNRCILCRRCVRACAEMAGNFTLSVAERGASQQHRRRYRTCRWAKAPASSAAPASRSARPAR